MSNDTVVPETDILIVYSKTIVSLHTTPNLEALRQRFLNQKFLVCKNNKNCLILTLYEYCVLSHVLITEI